MPCISVLLSTLVQDQLDQHIVALQKLVKLIVKVTEALYISARWWCSVNNNHTTTPRPWNWSFIVSDQRVADNKTDSVADLDIVITIL